MAGRKAKRKKCVRRNKKMSREAGTGRTVSEKAIGYLYGLKSVGEEKAYLRQEQSSVQMGGTCNRTDGCCGICLWYLCIDDACGIWNVLPTVRFGRNLLICRSKCTSDFEK